MNGDEKKSIHGTVTEDIGGDENVNIKGNKHETINGQLIEVVSGEWKIEGAAVKLNSKGEVVATGPHIELKGEGLVELQAEAGAR